MLPLPTSAVFIGLQTTTLAVLLVLSACSKAPEKAEEATQLAAPVFTDKASSAGLVFRHEPGVRGEYYFPEIMSGGVALLDFDGDDDLDVFLIQSGFLGPSAPEQPSNVLFENRYNDGELRFTNVTASSGLARSGYGMGAAIGDFDGDGDPDIYVTAFGPNFLFRNDGDGLFSDVTAASASSDDRWSTSAVFFDYDDDRRLDIYVINYVSFSTSHNKACKLPSGKPDYCSPDAYEPVSDRLLRNEGNGLFSNQTRAAGLESAYGPGLGVTVSDFDMNGLLDIYVANDGRPNQLWINTGRRFEDRGLASGAAYNTHGMTEASMGVTAGDFDGDGDDDLFMTHLRNETNTLYANDGNANFTDITDSIGIGPTSRPRTGFGTAWLDYDNDGFLDLFIANGAVSALQGQQGDFPYREPNQLYRNHNGSFDDVSATAGTAITDEYVSRGAAFGDIDNDGDTDIVVVNADGPTQLLINQIGNQNNWIGIDLRPGGIIGEHARVAVAVDGQLRWRTARRDGSYLSANDPRVLIGLAGHKGAVDVLVHWRDGSIEVWQAISERKYHKLQPGTAQSLANFCEDRQHIFCIDR